MFSNRKTDRKGDTMKNGNRLPACVLAGVFGFFAFCAVESSTLAANTKSGEDGFRKFCQACHPNGGNALKPTKNISKKVLENNGIKTVNDIIKIMRKPGEDMTSFDEKTLPENEARKIAEYIIKTF
jgi:cytochrome c6